MWRRTAHSSVRDLDESAQSLGGSDALLEEETLFDCRFAWYPGLSGATVAWRVIQQHERGMNHPEKLQGWFTFAGSGAGFMVLEAVQARQVSTFLE